MGKAPCHPNAMNHRSLIGLASLGLALASLFGASACHKEDGAPKPVVAIGDQTIAVVADERGFTPAAVETKTGSKLTLRFTRTTDATCADKVVFPDAGIEKDLPLKQPVDVSVPTDKARTLGFQCGMGMFKSSVVIR
jgi:plastocyanin domain-containing protein